jgi:hypothetical protein
MPMMRERSRMPRFAALAATIFFAAILAWQDDAVAAASDGASGALEVSSQARVVAVRPRPRARIRVTPRYPYRNYVTFYPLPYDVEYPGPNAVRLCDFRLGQELRPSGPVIVPRQRCWWTQR